MKTKHSQILFVLVIEVINQMKKLASLFIPMAVALALVTGCSSQQSEPAQQQQPAQQQPEQQPAQQPAQQTPANPATPNQPADSPKLVVKEGTGEYTGMIDGNSVEIVVNKEPKAFRLTEVSKPMVEKLKSKARVSFHYTEEEQLVLQDIQETK